MAGCDEYLSFNAERTGKLLADFSDIDLQDFMSGHLARALEIPELILGFVESNGLEHELPVCSIADLERHMQEVQAGTIEMGKRLSHTV